MKQILLFSVIGLVGFIVDVSLTIAFVKELYFEPMHAKLAAFPFAVTVTWLLNRTITFPREKINLIKEWISFIKVSMGGALINNISFYIAVSSFEIFREYLILAVGLGSVTGMLFNFLGSKFYVFR